MAKNRPAGGQRTLAAAFGDRVRPTTYHFSVPSGTDEEAVAGDLDMAQAVGADLIHNPADIEADIPFSKSVHSLEDAEATARIGASLVFVSPVFATRSHPGAPALGLDRAKRLAEAAGAPAIALGGMNARRFAELEGFYGWAGIDAWLSDDSRT